MSAGALSTQKCETAGRRRGENGAGDEGCCTRGDVDTAVAVLVLAPRATSRSFFTHPATVREGEVQGENESASSLWMAAIENPHDRTETHDFK